MSIKYRRRNRYGCLPYLLIPIGIAALLFFFRDSVGKWLDTLTGPQTAASGGPATTAQAAATGSPTAPPTPTEVLGPDGFPIKARPYVLEYTVKAGDALLLIAEHFHLSPNTIFWANSDTLKDNADLIQVGVQLYILPIDGVYHLSDGTQTIAQIATEYGVTPEVILGSEYNDLRGSDAGSIPPAGMHIVVPGGTRQYTGWLAPIHTGAETGRAYPQGTYHPGSCLEHYTGIAGSGKFINPLGGTPYRVTQGFEPWHPGVDLAADKNTPIYAADGGVVVFAGWHRDGYGNLVIIDHGGGYTTYYGHLNTRFVGCGDQVKQAQLIGQMGMTGNATGVHLHFEVRQNDIPQNPYSYITIQDERANPSGTQAH
jgi:murein DD-endopeptidase MepM/ murein hydrolase activator NlpD